MLTVGDLFPQFNAKACVGLGQEDLVDITHHTDGGKWKVFFFYPKDFTFVCPTEIAQFARRYEEFTDREAIVIGGSTDNEFAHLAWRREHEDLHNLPYPLIAAQKLAASLGILDPSEGVCLRATFIVDPQGVIQWVQANSLSVGRNISEILRVLDAIQSKELCPCNWEKGDAHLCLN